MRKPSHMEMAGWGLLSLLIAASLQRFWRIEIAVLAFQFVLPIAAARASGTFDRLLIHYACLVVAIVLLLTLGGAFLVDYRTLAPVTLELIPAIFGGMNPSRTDVRVALFVTGTWNALFSACAIVIPLKRQYEMSSILRAVVTFALFLFLHLALVRDRTPMEFTAEYRGTIQTGAVVGIFTLMPVYAGFYVALFYDLVRAANNPSELGGGEIRGVEK